jgi:hypothetical protein
MSTRLRASSLPDILDCPSRWAAKQIEGRQFAFSSRAALGNAIHAATAAFDSQFSITGSPFEPSMENAITVFHQQFAYIRQDWKNDSNNIDFPFSVASKTGDVLVKRYCLEIGCKIKYRYVEVTLKSLDIDVNGVIITLTGTTDRIQECKEGLGVVDLKSGVNRVTNEGIVKVGADKPQLGVYELLAAASVGEPMTAPALIAGLDTNHSTVGLSEPVYGARELLVGTHDQPGLLHAAALYIKSGIFPPNPKSQLCSEQYCPKYHDCNAHG